MTVPPLPGDGADQILPVLPRVPGLAWAYHIGGFAEPGSARISRRESSRLACLLAIHRRAEPDEACAIVSPDGAREAIDRAGAQAALDVERAGA